MIELSTQAIREHVGSASFIKGRGYYTSGKVKEIDIIENEDVILGVVVGSSKDPYLVEITIMEGKITGSDCSCPVGSACKHVAALGLKALVYLAGSNVTTLDLFSEKNSSSVGSSEWLKRLSGISSSEAAEEKTFELQILLQVERNFYHGVKVQVRPRLFDPETGSVNMTIVKWSNAYFNRRSVYWNGKQGNISLKQFMYLKMLAAALNTQWHDGWVVVSVEHAQYFWEVLCQHENYGVKIIGGQKGTIPVNIIQDPFEVTLSLDDNKNGVMISRKIFYKKEALNESEIVLVGDPISFAIRIGNELNLHPVTGVKNVQDVRLFDDPVAIPKKDLPLFEQRFIANLAEKYKLQVNTKQVLVPETVDPKPIAVITRIKGLKIKVSLGLQYEDMVVLLFDDRAALGNRQGKQIICNKKAALQFRQEVTAIFGRYVLFYEQGIFQQEVVLEGITAARFMAEILPQIQAEMPDLIVNLPNNLPDFKHDVSAPDVSLAVKEDVEQNDWFDLHINVKVGGEKVVFHELFKAVSSGEEYLLLESGRYFALNSPAFDKLRELIAEAKSLHETTSDGLKISRFQAGFWEELQKLGVVSEQAEKWQKVMQKLLNVNKVKQLTPPKELQATLRSYQQEGYSWLSFLHEYSLGGVLADDMGLGKTIQTIAFMLQAKQKGIKKPFLVVAPTSVVENWDLELQKFAPTLKQVTLRAGNRSREYQEITKADVVITSYALLVRDFEKLDKINFDAVILDEAQMVKNYQSKGYSFIRKLKSNVKIALTGTPMENNLMELWAVFSLVAPGLFPSPKQFQEYYRRPIEKDHNQMVLQKLRSRIRPFLMRRKKELVAKELPVKSEQILYLEMNSEHRHIYDLHLQRERERVLGLLANGSLQDHRFEILRSLTRMRQLCLHPQLVDEKYSHISATKLESLQEQIESLVGDNHKVLIFSQFTSFLSKVKKMLDSANHIYSYLDGATKNRQEVIKKFQENEDTKIFLISLKAGGFGLNLTAADYCILLDPWWNPAAEHQAVDRTHRIGQTKPVFVYKMILKNSIEEKVLKLQQKKDQLFKNILEEGDVFSSLITEQDIKSIFEN